ncbi:MAG: copper amine oxidase N-terminal domain-containing protein, partial [Clostridiales bacterium]|nr:copper amine oxidase N-terminal domain-containing protein [Clostridiales bacterium]
TGALVGGQINYYIYYRDPSPDIFGLGKKLEPTKVYGYNSSDEPGITKAEGETETIIEGCYRCVSTTVDGKTVGENDKNSLPEDIHGGVRSVGELQAQATYESNGWKFGGAGPWYWDSGLYPKLNLGAETNPFGFYCSITYHLNGGLLPEGAIQNYVSGTGAALPTPASLWGDLQFSGWFNNANFTGGPISAITPADTGNKEFWARWSPIATANLSAIPTAAAVLVNGETVAFDAYNIAGNNYFKLRDIAITLSGTAKQFEISWDGANNAISLESGRPYTKVGGEMQGKGTEEKMPAITNAKIFLDGHEVSFTAYNIDGNNYFKLRDIGQAFNFGVDWDAAQNTIVIDTDKGYTTDS